MERKGVDKDEDPYDKDYGGDGDQWMSQPNFNLMREVRLPDPISMEVSTFLVQ
jgi:hypothetical protein